MKKLILIISGLLIFTLQSRAQTIKDVDGNFYSTVAIGSQVWLKENLNVTHYRNGDEIPGANDIVVWENLKTGAYCNYDKLSNYNKIYGHLYNWEAISDKRGICPTGWNIPDDDEWATLIKIQGGKEVAGGNLKESGTEHWQNPNKGATNSSGFTALPGGCRRIKNEKFMFIGARSYFWSSSVEGAKYSRVHFLDFNNGSIDMMDNSGGGGYSIRCIKNNKEWKMKK